MSVLSDFTDELAGVEASAEQWAAFVRVMHAIDRDPEHAELRRKLEPIAARRTRFQDRCFEMLPLLRPLMNAGLH